jgi:hypothetical protein
VACTTAEVGKDCPTGGKCLQEFCLGDDGGAVTLPQCVPGIDAGATDGAVCTAQHPCRSPEDQVGCTCHLGPAGPAVGNLTLCLLLAGLAVTLLLNRRRGGRRIARRASRSPPIARWPRPPRSVSTERAQPAASARASG